MIVKNGCKRNDTGGETMKLLLKLSREALRYKKLYVLAILSTLCLTGVNLIAPKALSSMTGLVEGGITFEHVDFAYQAGSPVLQDVSFRCGAGKLLALVGPTGVGKTTLTQLISRFYEPDKGRILIDGTDIQDMTIESLRRNISPVLQDTFLFNGTFCFRGCATAPFVYYAGRSAGADFASRCCSQAVSMAETASTASGNASGSA